MISLAQLLEGLDILCETYDRDAIISSIALDARQVEKEGLFLAVQGSNVHGLKYLEQAIENGVKFVVFEKNIHSDLLFEKIDQNSTHIQFVPVKHLSKHVSEIAARFYNQPSKRLTIVAITGTNGKTTCAYLLAQMLEAQKKDVAIIGTLGIGRLSEITETNLTTPDAIHLQKTLAEFVSKDVSHVVMEASSHALAQHRLDAVAVDVSAFTNLSQDHLDFHGSMQNYLQSKLRLFQFESLKAAVLNASSPASKEILRVLSADIKACAFKLDADSNELCDLFGEYCLSLNSVEYSSQGAHLSVVNKNESYQVKTQLLGAFNIENLLLCLQVMQALDFELNSVLDCVPQLIPPPGRLQRVNVCGAPAVIVDYAHTPDALESVLETLNVLEHEELIAVFGCGGDRDKTKRPMMAEVAERIADRIVLTDDNPRSEKSSEIIDDVLTGIANTKKVTVISNRASAIKESIKSASLKDIVLIAGKGHENYQIIGNQKIHFSDYEHAYAALQEWREVA